MANNDI